MKVVVLGATGTIGSLLVERLHSASHEVVPVSRSTGVDAVTGEGLDRAVAGADAVVDCLNIETLSTLKAVEFFTTTAGNVSAAARRAGVQRVVCVSIAGVSDPAVAGGYGYYRGKAAQERAYRSAGLPLTIIQSTQWFELVEDIVRRTALGPVALVPTMRMAPVAADSVARLVVADLLEQSLGQADGTRELTIRGPETATAAQIARRILEVRGSIAGKRPRAIGELPLMGRAIATGGLIPEDGIVDDVTLEQWLSLATGSTTREDG
ncbi:SDR family oxidoreductase [Citricoccus sp. GCM10030269]|uniref:SDR family oxidoreductase n=1 Tax=Citricoccus sp. GCM10030269 TaxID=3273388 RepID=UPI003613F63A